MHGQTHIKFPRIFGTRRFESELTPQTTSLSPYKHQQNREFMIQYSDFPHGQITERVNANAPKLNGNVV